MLVAILASGWLLVPAAALDPARSLPQFVHQAWGPDQGFPGGTIYAISRSSDGYLWIGTDRGLVRFDGYTFELIHPLLLGLPAVSSVHGLALDGEGVLWIQFEGPHLALYQDGQFMDASSSRKIPDVIYSAMALDHGGNVLLSGFGEDMLRSRKGAVDSITENQNMPGTVISLAESRDGRIWVGTRDSGLFRVEQGRVSPMSGLLRVAKINALVGANNGGLWVGTDRGLLFLTNTGDLGGSLPAWTQKLQILALFKDRNGCVWAGTDKGLLRITPAGEASLRAGTEDQSEVNAVFEDREGNLWFGGTAGLERLQDGVFTTYGPADGFPSVQVGPIFADSEGGVWFAPLAGGLYWYKDGRLRRVQQDGLDGDVVYSIDGGAGDVWIARQRGGLTRIRDRGETLAMKTYTDKDGLAQNNVYAVHRSRNGTVWAGTVSGGLSVFDGSGFRTYTTVNGLESNSVNSITETSDGSVWVATPAGLEQFRDGHWMHFTTQNGLPGADVRLCFADAEGIVWIATGGGLAYFSAGRITIVNELPNSVSGQVLGITEDRLGSLWFSTSDHVLRIDREALLSGSPRPPEIVSYGLADGLSRIEPVRRERSLVSDASGRLWIALHRGIASGEPTTTARDSLPIHVRIGAVTQSGKSVSLNGSPALPAGTRSMTFHFEGDSLFAPNRVRFRYRLEDAESAWSMAGESRQVSYNNLGPGIYRFHVVASRDGRLWNSPETVEAFSIDRAYWQTWWFRSTGAMALGLLVLGMIRIRSIRLSRQLHARFQERLSERTRIAQELHDTLLQSFQGLMLRFQTVDNLLPARPGEAKKVLEEALDHADSAIIESRNAIQSIRSSTSLTGDLAHSIQGMMTELAEVYALDGNTNPQFSVVVEGEPRPLKAPVNAEVSRIARECLRNAFQHARASRIEAELTFGESQLRIRMRDDGVGIDPQVLKNGKRLGHWGMIGIKERASQVGAQLNVWSKPGVGTEVDLSVPGSIAYDRNENRNGAPHHQKHVRKEP